jgi:hypothetical protein
MLFQTGGLYRSAEIKIFALRNAALHLCGIIDMESYQLYTRDIMMLFVSWRDNPLVGLGLHPHPRGLFFVDHTQRRITVGRTPLDE